MRSALQGAATLTEFMTREPRLPLAWVTEMLYWPVSFAGAGMSDSRVGLRWLMVQRWRNFAKAQPIEKPPAAILVGDDVPQLPIWCSKPCGIEPLICGTWNESWEQVRHLGVSISKNHAV